MGVDWAKVICNLVFSETARQLRTVHHGCRPSRLPEESSSIDVLEGEADIHLLFNSRGRGSSFVLPDLPTSLLLMAVLCTFR